MDFGALLPTSKMDFGATFTLLPTFTRLDSSVLAKFLFLQNIKREDRLPVCAYDF